MKWRHDIFLSPGRFVRASAYICRCVSPKLGLSLNNPEYKYSNFICGSFYKHGLTLIPTWMNYYIDYNVCIYPFPNINGEILGVDKYFTGHVIVQPFWDLSQALPINGAIGSFTYLILGWSESSLVQVMACCLTASSHYMNQCWLIINEVLWKSWGQFHMRYLSYQLISLVAYIKFHSNQ